MFESSITSKIVKKDLLHRLKTHTPKYTYTTFRKLLISF